ncbi:MAG TPA: phage major capsid protein, partial [Nitrolancea sp.]|nr:phage major capsid protein [Nitrolancea sp.]
MSLTKTEAAKLTNDMFLRGVIETIIKESMVLDLLPFMEVTGTAVTYNREATMPAASFYAPLDTWTEATPTFTQKTATLKILGGDADVDNFLQQTYADPNDLEAAVIESRAKAIAQKWSDTFFNGVVADDANSFDGMATITPSGQTIEMAVNGAALTLDKMDELIDLVKPGRPDGLLMAKRTRRKLSSLRRASGNLLETDVDAFGRRALFYDGIPIIVDDWVPIDEDQGTATGVCSSIYAVKFGSGGIMGIENGGIQVEEVGELETKDATRH